MIVGERLDFVMTADQPVDNYWLRLFEAAVPSMCTDITDIKTRPHYGVQAQAIIRYEGAPEAEPSKPVSHPPLQDGDVVWLYFVAVLNLF